MSPEKKERYIRWQNHRISQLSFSINLFLGFSVASLAYLIDILLTPPKGNAVLECVLIIWALSAVAGCVATLSRLMDFRYTAFKLISPNAYNKFLAKYLGRITWAMFFVQITFYPYGAYLFISNYVLSGGP